MTIQRALRKQANESKSKKVTFKKTNIQRNKGDLKTMDKINFDDARFFIEFSFCNVSMDNVMYLLKSNNLESWQVANDTSIKNFGKDTCLLISPIMGYNDIFQMIQVFDILKENKASVNKTCYMHIHVYQDNFTYSDCIKLCNLTIPKERLIYKALGIVEKKVNTLDRSFIDEINTYRKINSMEEFKACWYSYNNNEETTSKRIVDFHDFFNGKGIKFQCFNGTLEFIELLAYVDLSIAMVQKAHNETCKPWMRHNDSNEARQFVDFLWGMGIRGKNPRFKATRAILTRYFDTNPWK